MSLSGGCLCGDIRFEVDEPTKWCTHCHCSLCRRAHGAGYVTFFGVDLEAFRITAGEESLRWYDSSSEARRGFCPRCGSTMFFASERWAGEMHIALAYMDGPIDRKPRGHVFFDSGVDWVNIADDLPKRGGPTGTEHID